MKKIFTFLTAILLTASMVTQAQADAALHKVDVKGTVKVTRRNAPQAPQASWNWTGNLEASDIESWNVEDWTDKLYLEVVTYEVGVFGFEFKTTDRDHDVDGNLIIPAGVYIMANNGSAVEGNAINGYTDDNIHGCFQFTDGDNWWIFDAGKVTVTKPDGKMSVNLYAWDDGNYQNNFNVYPPDNTVRQNQTINLSITNSNFTQSGDQFIFDATSSDGYRVRIRVRSSVIAGTYPTSKIRFFGNNTKETFVTLPNSIIKEMDMGQATVTQSDGRYSIDAYITSTDRTEYHIIGTPISYSVSVASNNASLGTVNSAGSSYLYGANSGTFTASATTGVFDGWYLDGNKVTSSTAAYTISNGGLSIQLLNLQSAHSLEARFNEPGGSYLVNYGVSPAGAGSITSATYGDAPGTSFNSGAELDGGTSITLTAGNNSGYRFDRWSNGVTNNPLTFMLIKDTTLTAQFIKTYVITATSSAGGSATGTGTYDVNAQATLTATSNNAHLYFFDHWELGGSPIAGGATIAPTVTADATYTAIFRVASKGTITGLSNNNSYGTVTVSPSGEQNGGTAVTLTPVANEGYSFAQWSDGNTDNPRTVYVDGDKTYTAQFVVETPLYAAVKYNTANHEIDWGKHGDQDWASSYMTWNSANDMFVRVRASDYTDNSMNHIQLCFWVDDFSVTYNGTIGPKAGTYTVVQPYVAGWNTGNNYWDLNSSYLNNAIVGSNPDYVVGGWRTDLGMIWTTSHSPYCAYVANRSCDYCSPTDFEGIPIGSTAKVEKGKGGYCYVEVRNASGTLLFTVGEKASSYTLAWDTNGGNITVAGTAAGSVTEGASITAPTVTRTGYTFNGWSPTFTGTMPAANTTYVAQWTLQTYDITYKDKDNADYSGSNLASLPATHTYNTPTNLVAGVKDGYTFGGWYTDAECTVSAGLTIGATDKTAAFTLYAKWERNVVNYNVTFTAGEHGSVSGAIGETAITSGQPQEVGSTVTLTATPDNFYSFVEWRNASNEQVVSTNAEYSFTLAEAVNLTAVFTLQETIELTDNFENGSQWQIDYAALLTTLRTGSDKAGKAKQKNVQLNRTFAAERWSTFALPFGYSLSSNQTHPFYGHVYSLVSAQYEEKGGKGYLTLNCMPNTTSIKANTPYVLITDKDAPIANPVFNNVRLTEIEENTTTVVQDVNNTGSVRFVNTEYRQRIDRADADENKRVIYLSSNRLYYPGGAIYLNAFRGYFYMNYSTIYHVAPRVRLVMPDGESIEQAEEETVETKKYIENGILVIERNGIKYDAQGHVIK